MLDIYCSLVSSLISIGFSLYVSYYPTFIGLSGSSTFGAEKGPVTQGLSDGHRPDPGRGRVLSLGSESHSSSLFNACDVYS